MNKKYLSTRARKPRNARRAVLIAAVILVILGLVITVLELTGTTDWHNKKGQSSLIQSTTTTEPFDVDTPTPVPPEDTPEVTPPPPSDKTGATDRPIPATGEPPASPSGNFVSNHHPNLGGKPAPTAMQSVCATTPGASCSITFADQNGVVKTLASQVTDATGTTFWDWDIKKAGFTTGVWEIKATATLGGQVVSSIDPLKLEVQP